MQEAKRRPLDKAAINFESCFSMTHPVSGYLASCQLLARRFADVTGGHARADLVEQPEGGVVLTYSQGCPHSSVPTFNVVYEDKLSLLRALDSLTIHLARALRANAEGLELARMTFEPRSESDGLALLYLYCPAWHQAVPVACTYQLESIPDGKKATLELVGPADQSAEAARSWDQLYDAGLVGELSKVLPQCTQAVAQFFMLVDSLPQKPRTVLLPGEHRGYTDFPGEGFVLSDFGGTTGYWNVYPQGNILIVDSPDGRKELPLPLIRTLNSALARWQAIGEAIADNARNDEA